jgi:hypothetical protein
MEGEQASVAASAPDTKVVLAALEVPFPPEQIHWRVTNTSRDKKRG